MRIIVLATASLFILTTAAQAQSVSGSQQVYVEAQAATPQGSTFSLHQAEMMAPPAASATSTAAQAQSQAPVQNSEPQNSMGLMQFNFGM